MSEDERLWAGGWVFRKADAGRSEPRPYKAGFAVGLRL
jgi:hypothetical protein